MLLVEYDVGIDGVAVVAKTYSDRDDPPYPNDSRCEIVIDGKRFFTIDNDRAFYPADVAMKQAELLAMRIGKDKARRK